MVNELELRIGNWIDTPDGFREVVRFQPTSITIKSYPKSISPSSAVWNFNSSECNPIPLNEKILKQCGFEYIGADGYKLKDGSTLVFYFSLRNGLMCQQFYRRTVESDLVKGCFYLHQLQNLIYFLTGTEINYTP